MRLGIDIDMEILMLRAQLGQFADQPLRCKKRGHIQPQAQQIRLARGCVDCNGERVERGRDAGQQLLAVIVEDHRLVAAFEQRPGDEALEALDTPAESGRGQSQFLGGGLDRAEASDLDEGLDGRERGKPTHTDLPRSPETRTGRDDDIVTNRIVNANCAIRNRKISLRNCTMIPVPA